MPVEPDPDLVEVRRHRQPAGGSPDVVEATYRAMITAFIDLELGVHADPHR